LVNEYGPTEATVWCTVHHIEPPQDPNGLAARVPIGRPIANTQVFLLDEAGLPVPVGVPGELWVGGAGLAAGYWNRPEQTAAAFVVCDLPGRKGIRLYRTGDIARFLPDGTIDLLGRADEQVKIRGQRIELGEIEAALRVHPDVRDAAVVVGESVTGVVTLAAFVETETAVEEIRRFIAGRVPRAMVPATIDALPSMPRGVTGKVDKKALPDPVRTPQPVAVVAPEGPVQQALAAIWCDVLGMESVGATEDFFELGGDSILSIRVIARGHKDGLRITPKQFFDAPTIAGLAKVVEETR
jgi:acyl-CoA synthetase (AMP-forming)/AMP-acid ligase II